jgi:hypothetical protein
MNPDFPKSLRILNQMILGDVALVIPNPAAAQGWQEDPDTGDDDDESLRKPATPCGNHGVERAGNCRRASEANGLFLLLWPARQHHLFSLARSE